MESINSGSVHASSLRAIERDIDRVRGTSARSQSSANPRSRRQTPDSNQGSPRSAATFEAEEVVRTTEKVCPPRPLARLRGQSLA